MSIGRLKFRIGQLVAAREQEAARVAAGPVAVLYLPANGRDLRDDGASLRIFDGSQIAAHLAAGLSREAAMERAWREAPAKH